MFTAINGKAGTGKTLLTYDIANNLTHAGKRVLLIHCGNLNDGHQRLNAIGWNIKEVKEIKSVDVNSYDVIIIDEVQRIWLFQFNEFVEKIKKSMCKCVFSYDKSQTLSNEEARYDIPAKIASLSGVVVHTLSEKIRTNKEVASFIRGFLTIQRMNVF
ncbi:TPA: ATP-binding protein [Proteus mirabilis]